MPQKEKIIVTGGAGYIGSHTVVELINAGYQPIIIDNFANAEKSAMDGLKTITGQAVPLYEGDCNDSAFMQEVFSKEKDIAGVIHFAAYKAVGESVAEPLKYYHNNIGSLLVLLKVMEQNQVKNLVFSSSCTVYGQPEVLPVTEQSPKQPAQSPYGNTKQVCEEILEDLQKSNASLRSIALRYFNPIGAHPSAAIGELPLGVPNNLVPFVTQTAAGIRKKITIFGNDYDTIDGTCIRDYIHVVDLAKAHVKAFEFLAAKKEATLYEVFNIGTGNGNSVLEVLETFQEINKLKVPYEIGARRDGDVEKVYANVDKSQQQLGWTAEFTLADALKDAWRWEQKLQQ